MVQGDHVAVLGVVVDAGQEVDGCAREREGDERRERGRGVNLGWCLRFGISGLGFWVSGLGLGV